ncbi:transporter substrate-binding domain-containing protein [Burkholderia sp. BCC1630]|uniref:transporter substrate-binding domain-containing protein n=1 Tax=Burkholderia sp. BCC1630 TaxID=2676304 RepID=UPI002445FCFD|nr:transporter substrate-binding domain-containing protein [Burkholderia sp. BCC1630]
MSCDTGAATACWKPIFTDEELRWISAHPVVHIAVEANWHPIEYMRNGRHAGLVAGYLGAISKMTGLTFQTVPGTEWGHAYDALAAGKVDLLPGVWRELVPDRVGAGALVSSPYLVGRLTAVTRNDSAMIFSLSRLEGRRIAIKGRGAVEYFTRNSGVKLDILTFDSDELALAAVADGEADAALGVDVTMLPIVRRRFPGQLYMSGMLADRPVSLAMLTRADLPILASIIDKSLAAIPVSETAAITRDWVELGDYGKPTLRSILHYRAPQVAALVVTLLIFALCAYLSWKSRAAAIRSKLRQGEVSRVRQPRDPDPDADDPVVTRFSAALATGGAAGCPRGCGRVRVRDAADAARRYP